MSKFVAHSIGNLSRILLLCKILRHRPCLVCNPVCHIQYMCIYKYVCVCSTLKYTHQKSLATLDGEIMDTEIAVKLELWVYFKCTMYKPNIYTI